MARPDPGTREGRIAQQVDLFRRIWDPLPFHEADLVATISAMYDRAYWPQAAVLQGAAGSRTPSRLAVLHRLAVPTLVIHGTEDPLVPPDRGKRPRQRLPGVRLLLIAEMGHSTPRACWGQLIGAILQHTEEAVQYAVVDSERGRLGRSALSTSRACPMAIVQGTWLWSPWPPMMRAN